MAPPNPLDAVYGRFQHVTPREAAHLLDGFTEPWWVGGGWAIEAFTGVSRAHEDLDICLDRNAVTRLVSHFDGNIQVWAAGSGNLRPLLSPQDRLPGWSGQLWIRRGYGEPWLIDFLLSSVIADDWVYKRDHFVTRPFKDATWLADDGIRYERPEVSLLYKAKHDRPKDLADLENALPIMEPEALSWFRESLARVHPGHRWLDLLVS